MFGQQDNQSGQTNAAIPDQSIDGALADAQTAPAANVWQHPGQPLSDDQPAAPEPVVAPAAGDNDSGPVNDLLNIKQQALGQLAPLVNHLDQTPEDKFRTVMMMIQATDDQTKIAEAYAAAQAIPDEKARAQALLDVINEINYFTQHHGE